VWKSFCIVASGSQELRQQHYHRQRRLCHGDYEPSNTIRQEKEHNTKAYGDNDQIRKRNSQPQRSCHHLVAGESEKKRQSLSLKAGSPRSARLSLTIAIPATSIQKNVNEYQIRISPMFMTVSALWP
jgi:hypothetical protein